MNTFEKMIPQSGEVAEEKEVLFDQYEKEYPGLFKDLFQEILKMIPENKKISRKHGDLKIGDYVEHGESQIDDKKHFGVFVCSVSARDLAADSDNPEIYARGDIGDDMLIMVHGNRSKGYHYVADDRMLVRVSLKNFSDMEWNYTTYGVLQPTFKRTGEFDGFEVDQDALAVEEAKLKDEKDNIMKKMVNAIRKMPYHNIDEFIVAREQKKIGETALRA